MSYFYIHPPFYALLFLVVYFVWVRKRFLKQQKRLFFIISGLFFYTISTRFTLDFFASRIEDQFPPIEISKLDKSSDYQILILGAGYDEDNDFPSTSKLNNIARARLLEGFRIYKKLPHAIIITSGYGGYYSKSTAKVMRDALIELGVKNNKIRLQESPVNTKEEAYFFKKHFSFESRKTIIVTSALHMKRAKAWFDLLHLQVITASCDYQIHKETEKNIFYYLPSTENWILAEKIGKEYLGYLFVK